MIQFLLAAPRSGNGKTTMTCALLMALKRRGCAPCAFKSGPDYIDPMFHRAVLGVESRNLDLFFSAPETVRTLYAKGAAGHGAAVCEGAMGFYDGLGGVSDRASAWHLADTLGLPVLLVAEPKGQSLTLAAELNGLVNFRTPSHIAGILLNNCTARMHALLAPMLEEETGLPVLGFLPKLPEAVIGSRHLGLYTAAEVENLQQKLALLADAVEEHIDWPRLLALCEKEPPALPVQPETPPARVRIAVAQDEAFCFAYAETLEAFRDAGAEVVFFSPLRDTALPENIGGLYLPGGYPELYAQAREQWQSGEAALYDRYQLLSSREQSDYARYRDQMSDYYAELDDARSAYASEAKLANDNYWSSLEYQADREDAANAQYWKQLAYADKQAAAAEAAAACLSA